MDGKDISISLYFPGNGKKHIFEDQLLSSAYVAPIKATHIAYPQIML